MKLIAQKISGLFANAYRSIALILFLIFPCMSLTSGSRMPSEYYLIHKDVVKYKSEVRVIKEEIKILNAQIRYKDSIDKVLVHLPK